MLHKNDIGVVNALAHPTSRSPLLMTEIRQLRFIRETNDISIRARYIKPTANIRADRLNCDIDYDDLAFNLRHFNHLDNMWGCHTAIDRFATMENARLPRYNSRCATPR
eukprot:jgi/Tetstr1/434548/TSEL_023639.t1